MSSLDKFKCYMCDTLPDTTEINYCSNDHLACGKCFNRNAGICDCGRVLIKTVKNPLLASLTIASDGTSLVSDKKPCRFKDFGCTWLFTNEELQEHLSECKYRIINCIGTTFGIWGCPWEGQQLAIGDHFQENHSDLGDFFSYFQESHIPFNEFITAGTINLIDAFNKKFVFFFHANAESKMAYFAIILMGMKTDAENYQYEFTIKSPNENSRKIKFVEDIYNTDIDIEMFLKAERCIVLTHRTLKNHLYNGNIHFRFVISKKDDTDSSISKYFSQTSLDSTSSKLKGGGTKVPNKSGKMLINRRSGGPSISTGSGGGGGGGGTAKVAIASAPKSTIIPGQLPNHSSINKFKLTGGICRNTDVIDSPCLMPSINKAHLIEQQLNANNGKLYLDPRISIADPNNPVSSVIKTNTPQPGYKQQTTKQYDNGIRLDGHLNGNLKYKKK